MIPINYILDFIANSSILTGYITNNTFPKPLTKKDEKYYLDKLKEGDLLAKNVLIKRNLRLVAHIVKKYSYPNKDMEDLISIGTIGLIKGIDSFDISKGTKLATYAAKCIENEILMFIRNKNKSRNEVYLQDPIGIDKEGNQISLMDVLSSEEDSIVQIVEDSIQIKKLYKKIEEVLQDREKFIVKMRYGLIDGKPRTQREIANILGISRSYVSRLEKRALKKLYNELNYDR